LLTLFVTPTLYLRFAPHGAPSISAEEDLLHRWAGVTPESADAEPEKTDVPAKASAMDGSASVIEAKEEA
jgi:hypothetical protein